MSNSKLNRIRIDFENKINDSVSLLQNMNQISLKISKKNLYNVYELSFLKIYLAWEYFIENTFRLYLMGESCNNNYKPINYFSPKNSTHVDDLLTEGRDYIKWTNYDIILRKAKLYFKNSEPYKIIELIKSDYEDMRIIRNAIAHSSKKANEMFIKLVRKKMATTPRKISPGKFLFTTDTSSTPSLDYFTYYKEKLLIISKKIVK